MKRRGRREREGEGRPLFEKRIGSLLSKPLIHFPLSPPIQYKKEGTIDQNAIRGERKKTSLEIATLFAMNITKEDMMTTTMMIGVNRFSPPFTVSAHFI